MDCDAEQELVALLARVHQIATADTGTRAVAYISGLLADLTLAGLVAQVAREEAAAAQLRLQVAEAVSASGWAAVAEKLAPRQATEACPIECEEPSVETDATEAWTLH